MQHHQRWQSHENSYTLYYIACIMSFSSTGHLHRWSETNGLYTVFTSQHPILTSPPLRYSTPSAPPKHSSRTFLRCCTAAEQRTGMRFLHLIRPVLSLLPEVAQPGRPVSCPASALAPRLLAQLTRLGHVADPLQREGPLDRRHALHLPRMLPDPALWRAGSQVR